MIASFTFVAVLITEANGQWNFEPFKPMQGFQMQQMNLGQSTLTQQMNFGGQNNLFASLTQGPRPTTGRAAADSGQGAAQNTNANITNKGTGQTGNIMGQCIGSNCRVNGASHVQVQGQQLPSLGQEGNINAWFQSQPLFDQGLFTSNFQTQTQSPSQTGGGSTTVGSGSIGTIQSDSNSNNNAAVIAGVTASCAVLLVIFFVWWLKRKLQQRSCAAKPTLEPCSFVKSRSALFGDDPELEQLIEIYRLPIASLETSENILGKGQFGLVMRAKYRTNQSAQPIDVAVKTVLDNTEPHRDSIINEVKAMAKTGKHLNIVNLVGIVITDRLQLVMEYCENGNLLDYIRKRDPADTESALAEERIADFTFQISRGMRYLASRNITHRDLAARNILISENNVLKVSDFGLSRQHENDYISNGQISLPVKWMPPESIDQLTFSEKSDVWAFGVLVWEICTDGKTPYEDQTISGSVREFAQWLRGGNRLQRPLKASEIMGTVMRNCWQCEPTGRPTFGQLEETLRRNLPHANVYLDLDIPYAIFNETYAALFRKSS